MFYTFPILNFSIVHIMNNRKKLLREKKKLSLTVIGFIMINDTLFKFDILATYTYHANIYLCTYYGLSEKIGFCKHLLGIIYSA